MGGFQTFLTKAFVVGIIIFIIFVIWGTGGGFSVIYGLGKMMKSIPIWFYLVIAGIWLMRVMFGGKR